MAEAVAANVPATTGADEAKKPLFGLAFLENLSEMSMLRQIGLLVGRQVIDDIRGHFGAAFARNNALLLERLADEPKRGARFYCALALVRHADDPQPIIADGVWRGQVLSAAQGDGGFGYDPLFQAQGESVSVAEMDAAAKNAVSHRGQAMRALAAKLAELGQA